MMDEPLRKLNALIARALKFVITVLIAVMVVPVTLQIFSRFFEFIPRYIWTEEVARFCLMWLIMLGATIAVRDGTHFDVDVLPEPKTARGKAVGQLIVHVSILLVALIFIAFGWRFAAFGYEQSSGMTEKLLALSRALVGHLPGGLGHVSVLVSMLFAGISGSSTAEAAGVGGVLIPAMKKQGYDTPFTVSLIACAAVMGVIIPPSILMVVWGGVISVSIGGLFLAGVVPGVLMGLSLMVAVYIYAKRRNYPVYARVTMKEFLSACGQAILPILTPGIIVGGIVFGFFTPTEASVIAVLYAMLLGGLIYRSLPFSALKHTLYDSARFAAIALFCIGTASAFGWILAYFHIPQLVVNAVSGWGGGITSVGFI